MVLSDHLIYSAGVFVGVLLVGLVKGEFARWQAFRNLRRDQLLRDQASAALESEWLEFSRRNPVVTIRPLPQFMMAAIARVRDGVDDPEMMARLHKRTGVDLASSLPVVDCVPSTCLNTSRARESLT